ncbi:Ferrous iron transport protein B [Streptococcus sp. ZB199]|nr:Ferrous iron transport protein B [Streptococcus sp. ZB199]
MGTGLVLRLKEKWDIQKGQKHSNSGFAWDLFHVPYSPEEKVARDYLLSQEADSILNVVDATNLERNLYLTTQLIETGIPVTVALNMSDVLEAQGRFIDTEKLSYQLRVPVIATSAIKQTGVEKAIKKLLSQEKIQ